MVKKIVIILMLISVQSYGQKQKTTENKKNLNYQTVFFEGIRQKSLENYEEAIQKFTKCIDLKPKSAVAFYQLALINRKIKNIEVAKENAKKATKLEPKNKWYRENYAEILFENENFTESIIEYKKLIKEAPKNQEYYFMAADMYVFLKKYYEAIKVFNQLESYLGENKKFYMQKHKLYMMTGDIKKALYEIEKLCLKFPTDLEALEILSELYFLNDMYEKGIKVLETITEIDPKNGKRHITLSKHYAIQGENEKRHNELKKAFYNKTLQAEEKVMILYQELTKLEKGGQNNDSLSLLKQKERIFELCEILINTNENNSDVHAIYGHFLYRDGQDKEAEEQYIQSLNINPNNTDVWTHLLFLQTKEKEFNKIIKTSTEALKYFPTDPLYYYFNGISNQQLKNYTKAIEAFETGLEFILEDNIFLPDFYSSLADIFHATKNHEKSDSLYERSLSYNFKNPIVLNNYSYYLSLRKKNLTKAEEMSRLSNSLDSNNGTFQDTYAWILYQMGEYKEAKKWIEKALKNGSNTSPVVLEHYGDILYKLKFKQEAIEQWKKAITLGGEKIRLKKKIKKDSSNE